MAAPDRGLTAMIGSNRVRNVVILASAVDAADKALLPATFAALSIQLGIGPSQLGVLNLAQSLAFSLALPIWGAFVQNFAQRELMVAGCCIFGSITLVIAGARTYMAHLILRIFVGAALAVLMPVSQAVICDVVPQKEQGWAFGLMQSISSLCAMVTTAVTTAVAAQIYHGIYGWRLAHVAVSCLAFFAAICVWITVPPQKSKQPLRPSSVSTWWKEQRRVLVNVGSKPSLFFMVLQGVTGSIPWNAFAFLPFFFQARGYSALQTSQILFWGGFGGLAGGILGGSLGDAASRITPYAGRLVVAQSSVVLGTVSFLWLMHMPFAGSSTWLLCAVSLFLFNAVASWTPAAALLPICGQIVASSPDRAQMLALLYAFSGIVSSGLGAPVVGLLSEMFGYRLGNPGSSDGDVGHASFTALRSALVGVSVIPWVLCFLAWLPLYRTYPADHRAAIDAAAKETASADVESYGATHQ